MLEVITITLLGREVVLTPKYSGAFEFYLSADKAYSLARYRDRLGLCVLRCLKDCVDARGNGYTLDEAVADLDTKLRQLREWLK